MSSSSGGAATSEPRGATRPDRSPRLVRDDDNDGSSDQREVDFTSYRDGLVILPDVTADDTDAGWGERPATNDQRLLEDRPPHWG